MVAGSSPTRQGLPSWLGAATATRKVELELDAENMVKDESLSNPGLTHYPNSRPNSSSDICLGFAERALSAAGAAVLSAILMNPLDVAKTRLQAQAAGFPYSGMYDVPFDKNSVLPDMKWNKSCVEAVGNEPVYPPDSSRYRGTLDVFYKVIRQEGFTRLWRGTNASLALAIPSVGIYLPCYDIFRNWMEQATLQSAPFMMPYVPLVAGSLARTIACVTCYPVELARTRMQAFRETQGNVKPPGVWKTLAGVVSPVKSALNSQNMHRYRILWTGLGAQLARDVPFSAICWSTLEPVRRRILGLIDDEPTIANVLGANFFGGLVAGSLAAAVTCPLDVARTRRQIEKDPNRALNMTTKQTLVETWRDGRTKGLFTGIGPRLVRAGPSVGIVVSFYEVVKYALHQRHATQ